MIPIHKKGALIIIMDCNGNCNAIGMTRLKLDIVNTEMEYDNTVS